MANPIFIGIATVGVATGLVDASFKPAAKFWFNNLV
jgi:hypothetical protein